MTQTKFLMRFCSPPSCVHPPPWARAGLSWCISFTCSVCALRCSVVSDSLWHCGLRPPGSAIRGIFQARILEGVAFPFSRGSSQPQAWTAISCISYARRWILYHWATWEALLHLQKWEFCVLQFWYVFFYVWIFGSEYWDYTTAVAYISNSLLFIAEEYSIISINYNLFIH